MKLATLKDNTRDGQLVVVAKDLSIAVAVPDIAANMLNAVENWADVEAPLQSVYEALNAGEVADSIAFDVAKTAAPLPRSGQFIDASAFLNHGNIMEEAFDLDVEKTPGIPILVQRQSDDFVGPVEDYPYPSEEDNGDFEGEFAVILDDMPMGVSSEEAEQHIKLVTIINDVSMRAHLFRELKMGFGFVQAKPATVFAPVAVTPDELGDAWHGGKIHLDMHVHRNGERFGNPSGSQMDFTFGEILSHIAYNRNLKAGAVIGSGTVSNTNWKEVGSACLAERRALDLIEFGEIKTEFLKFGDQLRFEVLDDAGASIFGAIDHKMVKA